MNKKPSKLVWDEFFYYWSRPDGKLTSTQVRYQYHLRDHLRNHPSRKVREKFVKVRHAGMVIRNWQVA
jgi:hypothetical protein